VIRISIRIFIKVTIVSNWWVCWKTRLNEQETIEPHQLLSLDVVILVFTRLYNAFGGKW